MDEDAWRLCTDAERPPTVDERDMTELRVAIVKAYREYMENLEALEPIGPELFACIASNDSVKSQ